MKNGKMNLNIRGISPEVLAKVHEHRIMDNHKNLNEAAECLLRQAIFELPLLKEEIMALKKECDK